MKYFQNLSGLCASLTLERGGEKRVGYELGGVAVQDGFVILHVTGEKRGMEIEQWKKC